MSRREQPWLRLYTNILENPKVQRLSGDEFKAKFLAAMSGQENEFSAHVEGPFMCRGRPSAHAWRAIRTRVFARDDYTCQYCGERGKRLECDHVIPVARGGSHDDDNLKTACLPCNRSKRSRLLSEWIR